MNKENEIGILLVFGLTAPTVLQLLSHIIQAEPLISNTAYIISKLLFVIVPIIYWTISRPAPKQKSEQMLMFSIFTGLLFAATIFGVLNQFIEEIKPLGNKIYQTLSNIGLTKNFLIYSLGIIIFNSFLEEVYWRYAVFGGLKKFFSGFLAAIISSLGFAAVHLVLFISFFEISWIILLLTSLTFLFGMYWSWLYHKSNSLLSVWVNHLLVNIPLFYIEYLVIFPA